MSFAALNVLLSTGFGNSTFFSFTSNKTAEKSDIISDTIINRFTPITIFIFFKAGISANINIPIKMLKNPLKRSRCL
ncbi:MAG TPA: hypothetical protein DCM59_06720 [Clostridium sp.]|nr:hypothetical protein [Clostridium sp.]